LRGRALKKRALKPWLFLLPAIAIYLFDIVGPSLYSLYLSFFKWNGVEPHKELVWLDNYRYLLRSDTVFLNALKNNLLWTVGSIVITTSFALGLALLLNRNLKGRVFFRGTFYFPYVLSGIVVAITWRWMYNPTQGFINGFLTFVGLGAWAIPWLALPGWALAAVFVAGVWQGVGQPMVLFLAGLQTIPREPYEAALLDGASPTQSLWHITLPLLRETTTIVLATTIISSMRVYDIIYAMTGGGPAESTQVLTSWMYYQTFRFANIGIGSAISWSIVLISLVVVVPYLLYTTKRMNA
jgi:raffinose/stachyose/melibiose transport system permease protein